ncbi:MAG: MBL fold metallo-hydrolase [Endomicrobiales bacterium]|jgi:L-ascorbate metabolism protein UlaG (beta-lactamase superfamily)
MNTLFKILWGVTVMVTVSTVPAHAQKEKLNFFPISHASFVIEADSVTIYVDPTGDVKKYKSFPPPDIILVTHEHYDHFDKKLISALKNEKTMIIGPQVVIDELSYGNIVRNGESKMCGSVTIEAVPAYNMSAEKLKYHPKGVGNGYVVTVLNKRIYISGDTEDTPEMRGLKQIDYAFVCMNLPYTMSIEQAASGVLAFRPKTVFPYHFRQSNGFADVRKFKDLVATDKNIEVKILTWY